MPMIKEYEGRKQCRHCGYWHLAHETCGCLRVEITDADYKTPLTAQVGGSHYKDMAIQPCEYTTKNGIGHLAGDAIAYISRYRSKNGREDLEKAIHSIQLLIELEYGA